MLPFLLKHVSRFGGRENWLFYFNCLSGESQWSIALPRGAVGQSAVSDCAIFDHTRLLHKVQKLLTVFHARIQRGGAGVAPTPPP